MRSRTKLAKRRYNFGEHGDHQHGLMTHMVKANKNKTAGTNKGNHQQFW